MAFTVRKLDIPEVLHVQPDVFADVRGAFAETFKASEFKKLGIEEPFVQVNRSSNRGPVLRGLHYQLNPKAQGKLISVVVGSIFDVAVDIRKGSPTFGKWVGETLTAEGQNMLYVPEGFAHGFYTLSETAEVIYYCTDEYSPEHERGIAWNDASLAIAWPGSEPLLSDKDKAYPVLAEAETNFEYNG